MKRFRTTLPILASVVVLAAAAGTASAKDPPSVRADKAQQGSKAKTEGQSQSDTGKEKHATRPYGGGSFLVYEALHEDIGLSSQQRTKIEGVQQKAQAPAPDAANRSALAKEIRAGKIDPATVKANAQSMTDAMKQNEPVAASNVATLHETLSKDQRAKLVGAIEAKQAKHAADEAAADEQKEGTHGLMGYLLKGIDLTSAQRDQINAKLAAQEKADRDAMKAQHDAMKKEMDTKLQTFKSDNFDAKAFVTTSNTAQKAMQAYAPRFANELQSVVSVLGPTQREQLAQKVEQGPPADQP